eukprot:3174345-Pyramimonas_sp.AAC.1
MLQEDVCVCAEQQCRAGAATGGRSTQECVGSGGRPGELWMRRRAIRMGCRMRRDMMMNTGILEIIAIRHSALLIR